MFIAAEMQFYSGLQENIDSGEFVPSDEEEKDWGSIMKEHILECVSVTDRTLKYKIIYTVWNLLVQVIPQRQLLFLPLKLVMQHRRVGKKILLLFFSVLKS